MRKTRTMAVALSLLALAAMPVLAQDKPKPAGAPAMSGPEMEAMMKAMTPGEQQKRLANMAGDWTVTTTLWMDPSQPPAVSDGTMHAESIMGGRYVESVWHGSMMGMPFEGRGTDGYDNVAKQYVSSWVDNMGTGIMYLTGSCDDGGKKCTMTSDMIDPMSGKKTTVRQVSTWQDANDFTLEMYGADPTGKEFKMMQIAAKRK
jgi:hypothetical protein